MPPTSAVPVIHKDLFARAYRLSQLHKEVATAIIYPLLVRWDIAFPIVLQQVYVQVFAPIGLVAVTTSPGSGRYSAVLHELGMGIHHSPLLRASFANALHLSTVRYMVVTFTLITMSHQGFGFKYTPP